MSWYSHRSLEGEWNLTFFKNGHFHHAAYQELLKRAKDADRKVAAMLDKFPWDSGEVPAIAYNQGGEMLGLCYASAPLGEILDIVVRVDDV